MRDTTFWVLISCFYLLTNNAYAQTNERFVSVQGNADIWVVPDAFTVTFVIEERGSSVEKLNASVQKKTAQIIKFMRKMSVEERKIETMQISLNPYYERYDGPTPSPAGFVLSRSITVTHSDIDSYDKMIDGALRSGANRIEQFSFVVSNQERLYEQALVEAMKDAQKKAELILKPTDSSITGIVSISEAAHNAAPRMRTLMASSEMTTALPGSQSVSANLSVVFSIK